MHGNLPLALQLAQGRQLRTKSKRPLASAARLRLERQTTRRGCPLRDPGAGPSSRDSSRALTAPPRSRRFVRSHGIAPMDRAIEESFFELEMGRRTAKSNCPRCKIGQLSSEASRSLPCNKTVGEWQSTSHRVSQVPLLGRYLDVEAGQLRWRNSEETPRHWGT